VQDEQKASGSRQDPAHDIGAKVHSPELGPADVLSASMRLNSVTAPEGSGHELSTERSTPTDESWPLFVDENAVVYACLRRCWVKGVIHGEHGRRGAGIDRLANTRQIRRETGVRRSRHESLGECDPARSRAANDRVETNRGKRTWPQYRPLGEIDRQVGNRQICKHGHWHAAPPPGPPEGQPAPSRG